MLLLGNRVLVSRVDDVKKEGFITAEVQDSFVYRGKIEQIGDSLVQPTKVNIGNIVLFSKYSPDTQEVDVDGNKMKIVRLEDILAIL